MPYGLIMWICFGVFATTSVGCSSAKVMRDCKPIEGGFYLCDEP